MFVTTNLISFANIRTCAQQAKACTEFAYQTFHSHLKLGKNGLPFSKMQKKKRLCRKALATFVVLLCPLAIASAQAPKEGQDVQLTVRSAIETARKSSPALNQIRAQIRGKKGQKWMSVGLRSPELLYFKEGIEADQPGSFSEKRLAISQSLDFPLRSYFRIKQVGNEQSALEQQLKTEELALDAEVKKSYTTLAFQLEMIHLAEQKVQLAQRLQEAATTRFELGEASELDLMRAEIQLAEAQNDLGTAQKDLHQARYYLFNLIGFDPEEQTYAMQFPDTLTYFELEVDQEIAMTHLMSMPEYQRATLDTRAAAFGVKEAWSKILPDIRLMYYQQDFGSGYDYRGFEVGISLPLWFAFEHRGSIQQASARQNAQKWQQRAVFLSLKQQAENAWHGFENSRENIRRFHQVIRVRAQNLLDLTLEGYQAGELDLLAFLEAQRTYLSSESGYFSALRDYYFRLIELEKFIGKELVFQADE